jgi:hypothetical protein
MAHDSALAAGDGDRGGSGIGLERPGVGEALAVVADLTEDSGASERADAGKAGEDARVGMLGEGLGCRLGEVVGCSTGRVGPGVPSGAFQAFVCRQRRIPRSSGRGTASGPGLAEGPSTAHAP